MKTATSVLFILAFITILTGCKSARPAEQPKPAEPVVHSPPPIEIAPKQEPTITPPDTVEPPAVPDLPPPSGYSPIFVEQVAPFRQSVTSPYIFVSRVQMKSLQEARIYVHILDSSGVLYTNIKPSELLKLICEVTHEFNGHITQLRYRVAEVTSSTALPYSIAFVLDHSGSMGEDRAFALQDYVRKLVTRKRPQDEFAVVKFDHKVVVESFPTQMNTELLNRIQRSGLKGFGGYTAIADGAKAGLDLLANSAAPSKAVVVFTDGYDNKSSVMLDSLVAQARAQRVPICPIGFGYSIDENYLQRIATVTGGMYQRIYQTAEFDSALSSVYTLLQNYIALDMRLTDFGVHRIRIKLCPPPPAKESTAEVTIDNTPDLGSINLLHVNFTSGSAVLSPSSKSALDTIAALMKSHPTMVIEVRGHTDSTGSEDYNVRLSERRANAIRAALIRYGIEPDRIQTKGLGSSQPIADNRTRNGRALNRRTEFVVLRK